MARRTLLLLLVLVLAGTGSILGGPATETRLGSAYSPTDLINLVQWPKASGGNDHWYAVYPVTTHWQGAKAAVEALVQDSLPGYLATITSAEENEFITTQVLAGTTQPMPFGIDQFYLGCALSGTWSWLTGEAFAYSNWGTGEPNNAGIENAMAIFGPNNTDYRRVLGYWNSVVLSDAATSPVHNAWSVVEFGPVDTSGQPTDLINLVQWPKASGGNDHWYAVYPVTTHWQGAKAAVEALVQDSLPGYLATITSAEENEFITTQVLAGTTQPMPFGIDQFYLGCALSGTWSWLTGEAFAYSNWGTGEPNNAGIENAMAIFGPNNTDYRRVLGYWNSVVLSDAATSPVHNAWSVVEFGPVDTSGQPTDLINLVQWPKASGGNDHWYAVYPVTTHWQGAKAAVEALVQDSLPGYLATITSAEENEFITTQVLAGTTQPMPFGIDQFYLGCALSGTWSWLTGEAFAYSNWGTGEPNNAGIENAMAIFGPNNTDYRRVLGYWNSVVLSDAATSPVHNAWSVVEFGPLPCCIGVIGNVNGVGTIDLSDLSALIAYLTGEGEFVPQCAEAVDCNRSGTIEIGDLSILLSYLMGPGYDLPSCP